MEMTLNPLLEIVNGMVPLNKSRFLLKELETLEMFQKMILNLIKHLSQKNSKS